MGSRGRILAFLAQAQKWPGFKTACLRTETQRHLAEPTRSSQEQHLRKPPHRYQPGFNYKYNPEGTQSVGAFYLRLIVPPVP
jgi:hypothetical protein